jgi:hypothetical protein
MPHPRQAHERIEGSNMQHERIEGSNMQHERSARQ